MSHPSHTLHVTSACVDTLHVTHVTYSLYWLYWYKSTNTDKAAAINIRGSHFHLYCHVANKDSGGGDESATSRPPNKLPTKLETQMAVTTGRSECALPVPSIRIITSEMVPRCTPPRSAAAPASPYPPHTLVAYGRIHN